MSKTLGILFGPMADPISKQLHVAGFDFDKETVKHLEKDLDAIVRLRIRDFLPDRFTETIYTKLYKRIEAHVMKHNGLTQLNKPDNGKAATRKSKT